MKFIINEEGVLVPVKEKNLHLMFVRYKKPTAKLVGFISLGIVIILAFLYFQGPIFSYLSHIFTSIPIHQEAFNNIIPPRSF